MRVAAILFAVLTTVGCASTTAVETGSAPAEAPAGDDREAAIYSAVIRQLVMKDNMFGSAPTSFKVVYVLDRPIAGAADPQAQVGGSSRLISAGSVMGSNGLPMTPTAPSSR